MGKKLTPDQREAVLQMLARGEGRDTIVAALGVTPGQVSAISAHVKMGTYSLPTPNEMIAAESQATGYKTEKTTNLLQQLRDLEKSPVNLPRLAPILLGTDAETQEPVYWNPDPETGAANPHVLVLGESGFGKTYMISCLLAELAQENITSVIFDYGQGFSRESSPAEFVKATNPLELLAVRDGIDINPLQIFPTDLLGPVNVAQRVADTFRRVYRGIGVQQHAILRQAVLEAMKDSSILADKPESWTDDLPAFGNVQRKLLDYAEDPVNPHSRHAATAASHISTLFVFNTFRNTGKKLTWPHLFDVEKRTCIIQLKGLEHSLESAVTELLLWNLIGYIEALGPSPLRCFVVLDEAHKLSFDRGSPVEKLLREGRKFGLGLILASQQPEDFSSAAFANTATKIIFQVGDERSTISRQLHRKIKNAHSFAEIYQLITKLPRGWAYVVTENIGRVVKVASFPDRVSMWA
jgi:DNA phosphorothioation-dependent restriction protein DptH